MKLFQQITTQRQGLRLKQLRLRVKGLFKWKWDYEQSWHRPAYMNDEYYPYYDQDLPAFTVSELGEMMKDLVEYNITSQYSCHKKVWLCTLWKVETYDEKGHPDQHILAHETFGFSEAEARCDMLFYLIENEILSVRLIHRQMQLA
jgi:hypothetical protein